MTKSTKLHKKIVECQSETIESEEVITNVTAPSVATPSVATYSPPLDASILTASTRKRGRPIENLTMAKLKLKSINLAKQLKNYKRRLHRVKAKTVEETTSNSKPASIAKLPTHVQTIYRAQLRSLTCRRRGMRWTDAEIEVALSIFHHDRSAYKFTSYVNVLISLTIID